MMKKVISLILALMIVFSLALSASANGFLPSPERKPDSSTSPKTGDTIGIWVGGMAVSAVGLAAVMAARKKEQQ